MKDFAAPFFERAGVLDKVGSSNFLGWFHTAFSLCMST